MNQFLEDGYDGEQEEGTFRDDIWFGVVEQTATGYDGQHPAWGKAGVNWSRIASRFQCEDGTGCQYIYSFLPPDPSNAHATQVAGLIFADLTEGQDPDLSELQRRQNNGFARNALGRLFLAETTASWDEIIDKIRGPIGAYEHVVNLSLVRDSN